MVTCHEGHADCPIVEHHPPDLDALTIHAQRIADLVDELSRELSAYYSGAIPAIKFANLIAFATDRLAGIESEIGEYTAIFCGKATGPPALSPLPPLSERAKKIRELDARQPDSHVHSSRELCPLCRLDPAALAELRAANPSLGGRVRLVPVPDSDIVLVDGPVGADLAYWRSGPAPAGSPYADCRVRAGVVGCPAEPHHHTDPASFRVEQGWSVGQYGIAERSPLENDAAPVERVVPVVSSGRCQACGGELDESGRCRNGSVPDA